MPQIIPQDGPTVTAITTQGSARDRAVASLKSAMDGQGAPPVPNPNNISVEELGAVKAPEHSEETKNNTSEDAAPPAKSEEVTPDEKTLSSQYAQLARREKALRAQAQGIKSQLDALQADKASFEASKTEMQKAVDTLKRFEADPWSVLQEKGVTYDQLTNRAMNAPSPEQTALQAELQGLRDEIKGLKSEQETSKKASQEGQQRAYQQAKTQLTRDVHTLVKTNGDDYEMIASTESYDDVVELIEKTFNEENHLLSVHEAAKMIEDELLNRVLKLSETKKVKSKFQATQAPPKETQAPNGKSDPKTLSNAMGSSAKLSPRDRAVAAFQSNTKRQ